MAEDQITGDIHHAEVYRTNSNRRYVSTPFPYSCQIGQTNPSTNDSSLNNSDTPKNIPVDASNKDLNTYFSEMHCNPKKSNVEKDINSEPAITKINDNVNGARQENPVATPTTSRMISLLAPLFVRDCNPPSPLTTKRKRTSPQTRNVREKLLTYAYKNRSTKNVTFVLQADEDATTNVDMEERVTNSSSTTSIDINPIQVRSLENLNTALPQRLSRPASRHSQQSEAMQTLPTEEQMRKYQVPDSKAPIWKLYEQKLRIVGRCQSRIETLSTEITNGNPPSWCFGGTQAPQYMRPFHPELVALSLEYAMKMAITARNLLIRETDQEAEQVRHLQETLSRMYKQDKDPNFELAIGRAEGIAQHYTHKERALNIRLSEEDQANIPTEVSEWADILCRRKVNKPNARSRSRSRSRDKKQRTSNKAQPSTSQNQKKNTKNNYKGSAPPKNPKGQQHQGTSFQQWKLNQESAKTQAARNSTSNTSVPPRPSSSSTYQRNVNVQPNQQTTVTVSGNNVTNRPTTLNEEELRLITMLRASKN